MRALRFALLTGWLVWSLFALRVLFVVMHWGASEAELVRGELAFLRAQRAAGAATRMQALFPEGYLFLHVLYGLAAHDRAALADVESEDARSTFQCDMQPRCGIFYAGWTLLLRAELGAPELARHAEEIAAAYEASESPFLQAYPGRAWPVDNVVAIAALRRVDQLTGSDHGALIQRWLKKVSRLRDPETGLLPHEVDLRGGMLSGSRGTSQSIIQRFWPLVDPVHAARDYARFRELFLAAPLGWAGIREYPRGREGEGDVDSGPLIFGLTPSGSAVAAGAARVHGDLALAEVLLEEADVLGVPLTDGDERAYLFAQLPVADAFLTWARTAPAAARVERPTGARWPLYTLAIWLALGGLWWLARVR